MGLGPLSNDFLKRTSLIYVNRDGLAAARPRRPHARRQGRADRPPLQRRRPARRRPRPTPDEPTVVRPPDAMTVTIRPCSPRRRRDAREPRPRAGRLREARGVRAGDPRRLPPPPLRPRPVGRGDPGRGRRRGRSASRSSSRPSRPSGASRGSTSKTSSSGPSTGAGGSARRCWRRWRGSAVERGCGRLEWSVLDWNAPAIGFYRALGAHGRSTSGPSTGSTTSRSPGSPRHAPPPTAGTTAG